MNSTFWHNSIVLIRSSDPSEQSFGTGFVIYKDTQATYLLTCTHVVREVGGSGKIQINGIQAHVVTSSPEENADLAILRVAGLLVPPPLPLCAVSKKGEAFRTAGFQRTAKQFVIRELRGTLREQLGVEMKELGDRIKALDLEVTGKDPLQSGYSGSPVMNKQNHVIAVVDTLQGEGKRGVAISVEVLGEIWPERPPDLFRESETSFLKSSTTRHGGSRGNRTRRSVAIAAITLALVVSIAALVGNQVFNLLHDASNPTPTPSGATITFDALGGSQNLIEVYPGVGNIPQDKTYDGVYRSGDTVSIVCETKGRAVTSNPAAGEQYRQSDVWYKLQTPPGTQPKYATAVYADEHGPVPQC